MDLREIQASFAAEASKLGDYALMTKTELANGYCDADEAAELARQENRTSDAFTFEERKSAFYAALMLRYWHKIFEWMHNSSSLHLDPDEFIGWLSDSFYVVFYYRMWRYEYKAEVKHGKFIDWVRDDSGNLIPNPYYYITDPNAPDKIINRCCASMRGRVYQFYNKDKRKASVTANSIEQMVEEAGDSAAAFSGCYEDAPTISGVQALVTALLHKGNDIEALIIDGIAHHDAFKTHKLSNEVKIPTEDGEVVTDTIVTKAQVFDARRLVKHLTHINPQFMRNFCAEYSVEIARGDDIYNKLTSMSNPKLYRCIEKTLIQIRDNPALLSYIC